MDDAFHGGAPHHRGVLCPDGQRRQFYPEQPALHQRLWLGVRAQPAAGPHRHGHLPDHRVPRRLFSLPPAGEQAAHHADAGHAAHVDELSAPHLCVDGSAQRQRPGQRGAGCLRPWPIHHAEYLRCGGTGHGVQLRALYDPAALHQHDQDRPEHRGGGAGPGRFHHPDPAAGAHPHERTRHQHRHHDGLRPGGVHLRHQPDAGRRFQPADRRPDRDAVPRQQLQPERRLGHEPGADDHRSAVHELYFELRRG